MTKAERKLVSAAMSFVGQIGGSSTSKAKQAASRENGKLGGRPRKRPTNPRKGSDPAVSRTTS